MKKAFWFGLVIAVVLFVLVGSAASASAEAVDCIEIYCLWVEPGLHNSEHPNGARELTVPPMSDVQVDVTLYKAVNANDLLVDIAYDISLSYDWDFEGSIVEGIEGGSWVSRDGHFSFVGGTMTNTTATVAITITPKMEGVFTFTPEISTTIPVTYCEICSQTVTVTVENLVPPTPMPIITSISPEFVVSGERLWIFGENLLDGPSHVECGDLYVFIHDPIDLGNSMIGICDELVSWGDSGVSFLWPDRLKEYFEYEIRVVRFGAQSNTVSVQTGGKVFLPLTFK